MKILLFTDPHFGIHSDSEYFINYQLSYLKNQLIPYYVNNNINVMICLGDFFHNRKSINVRTLHLVKEKFLDVLKSLNINLIIISGNHDLFYTKNSEITSLNIFKDYNNIDIYNKMDLVKFDESTTTALIPWLANKDDEIKNFINENNVDYIFGHMEFNDFQMIKGVTCKNGLNHKDFSNLRGIFLGHFHNRQIKENLKYIGAPFELSWNAFGEDCGFEVFDTITHKSEFIKNEDKIYHKIFYKENENYNDDYFKKYKDKILKIYPIERTDNEKFLKFIKKIEEINPYEYQIVEQGNIEKEDIVIDDQETLLETFKLFLVSYYNKDKDILFNIAEKLYNEVGME